MERKFKFKEDTYAEGRYFYRGVEYIAQYEALEGGGVNVAFFADNGAFNFPPDLFEKLIVEWSLEEVAE